MLVLFDRIFVDQMAWRPQGLTFLGVFEPLGLSEHNRRLDDLSVKAAQRQIELIKSQWAALQSYPVEG